MARQTFVTYLKKATEQGVVVKRESGRTTYYSLKFNAPETETLKKWGTVIGKRLAYIPDEIRLI